MSTLIAWRNLTHDRARFAVTLIGIAFSVILMGMQVGLLLNVIGTTSVMAAHSSADIFVTAPGVRSVDIGTPQSEKRRYEALSVEGVGRAEVIMIEFNRWKRPDGVSEVICMVGVAPNATMELPWALSEGEDAGKLLDQPDGVIIDRLYADKLGISAVGQMAEINAVRVRVVAFTHGIRTFTQSPFVFASLATTRRIMGYSDRRISYVLIKVADGFTVADVADRLRLRLPDAQILTAAEFASSSARYWLLTTGAGVSLLMSAGLGLIIGGVIVAQTLYANTMDRLPEYATLRAIGGSAGYLYRIVLNQAALAGAMGYFIGIIVVGFLTWLARDASAAPEMPPWLAIAIGGATLIDCFLAAAVSLRVVTRIDPVKVFR